MVEYTYERAKLEDGRYNIDHPLRVDGEGNQIRLSKEIEAALPTMKFVVRCDGTECKIIFEGDLTPEEKTVLGGIVAAHKLGAA